jgi:hypothetical protein
LELRELIAYALLLTLLAAGLAVGAVYRRRRVAHQRRMRGIKSYPETSAR